MKIVGLKAENIKRLRAVEVTPDPSAAIIEVAGENEQGKTSLFDAIRMAIGGSKATPDVPVRRGASEGTATIDLGDISIEFWTDGKDRRVIVRDADGKKQTKPQAILDRLYSKVAFDPLEFSRQKPAEQVATLKRLVGLDFSELDAKRAKLYEERTRIGYARGDAEARVNTYHADSMGAPDVEVDVSALLAQKQSEDEHNQRCERAAQARANANSLVAKLEAELAQARHVAESAESEYDNAGHSINTTALVERIKGAEDVNRKVRAKRERRAAVDAFKAKDAEFEAMTRKIYLIDEEKERLLATAKWPVPGMGFSDLGITVKGLPFEQASKAERMKVSLSIGAALNPELRVMLLEDASLLDKSSRAIVEEVAREKDLQVWIEVVGDGGPGAIVIEDGMISSSISTDI